MAKMKGERKNRSEAQNRNKDGVVPNTIDDSMDAMSMVAVFTESLPMKPKKEKVELKEEPNEASEIIPSENKAIGEDDHPANDNLLDDHPLHEGNMNDILESIDRFSIVPTFTKPRKEKRRKNRTERRTDRHYSSCPV
ncbi:hypothetical protein PENTCL1PPCAC_19460 [Pristionchus entomophagus]|uniref:Uncharacterized protein n=1 Tax=Pristionchus entomophagus TaxID=358040 RepID=A0AAV5TS31_9BILA|nr:hypothetical protein PENTCL1PPCAC_19460 [Pristionchus entomophagus]